MPVVFATIHGAYGTGFLLGLVRFLPRWFEDASRRGRLAPFHLGHGKETTVTTPHTPTDAAVRRIPFHRPSFDERGVLRRP